MDQVKRGMSKVIDPAFRDLQLAERMIPWAELFLPSRTSRYLLGHYLCRASGLKHEGAQLMSSLRQESVPGGASNPATGIPATLAKVHVAMTAQPPGPALTGEMLPFLSHFLGTVRVVEPSEALFEEAFRLFAKGFAAGALDDAEKAATDALDAARKAPNPEVVARASMLLARIAERRGVGESDVIALYEQATLAAFDSASQELIGLARGETGIYLWTRLGALATGLQPPWWKVLLSRLKRPGGKTFDAADTTKRIELCRRAFAEAYRIHLAQRDHKALKIIAGNLGDVLDCFADDLADATEHGARLLDLRPPGVEPELAGTCEVQTTLRAMWCSRPLKSSGFRV